MGWLSNIVKISEAEYYLKSFAILFTAFINQRPDAKVQLDECHSYIMDTYYIAKTWSVQKKEKLRYYSIPG
jgi:hypothetical protein